MALRTEGNRTGKENRQKEMQQHILEKPHSMILSGFLPAYNGSFPSGESKEIQAAVNQDSLGFITCEYTLPFRTFYPKKLSALPKAPVFGVEMILPAATFPFERNEARGNSQRPEGEGQSSGGHRSGGHRMGGGEMGGGQMGGNMGGSRGGRGMREQSGPSSGRLKGTSQEDATIKFKLRLNTGSGR